MTNEEITQKEKAPAEEKPDMIVCGYVFTKTENSNMRILNLREPHHALVLSPQGEVLETTMDDVEINIVKGYLEKNKKTLEDLYA